MAALVVGADLGLGNSSLNSLGLSQGSAAQGQAGEGVYVNLGTGNLVLQQQDEMLFGLGLLVSSLRTYNSQGVVDGDNNDNWRIGFYRQLGGITGTPGAAGSSVTRTAADGANERYVWDAARACYISTDGAGTYRTLSLQADGAWLWQDGRGASETYQSINGSALLLRSQQDGDGNLLRYEYAANGLLQKVTSASGETTELVYDSAPGREANLLCLRTGTLDATTGTLCLQTRVRYAYDDLNRLTQVTVDLSPQDDSIADGKVYITRYSYEGSSHRISSLRQSDGGSLSFAYDSAGRVISITDALGAVTRYGYEATRTTVTDAAGNVSRYGYDGKLQLTSIEAPAANGVSAVRRFQYNDNGDVTLVTDADGLATEFQYDAMGNQILRRDAQTEVRMQYNARNQLLSETRTPAGSTGPALTTRYVYDASGLHLRFAISAEGRVVEYRYNALGQRDSSIAYSAAIWAGTDAPDEAAMSTWLAALADSSQAVSNWLFYDVAGRKSAELDGNGSLTEFRYDLANRLVQTIRYATAVTASIDSQSSLEQIRPLADSQHDQTSWFFYDTAGRLSKSVDAMGAVTESVYDAAGRVQSQTRYANAINTATLAAGTPAESIQVSANAANDRSTRYFYDNDGLLRGRLDAEGHPMMYASNDVPDPSFPRDKVEVGFGGYGGNDPQLVPSAMSKFVSEYTAQHPNASMEEVQAAYDRTEAEQSDYYLSRRVAPASNGPLTITATNPQLLNVPEPEPGLMRGLAGNEQNRSVTDPRPSITENFGLALNGALNGLVGMVKEPFAAAADGLRSSYQLGRGAMGLPMQQFRPYSAAGAAGATGMSYGEFAGRAIDGIAGSPARLIADGLNGNWKGFGAELLGTTGLAVGIGGLRAEAPRGLDYGAVWLDSLNIRQSQQSISYAKKGGYTLDDIARGYAENPSHPDLTIDVVRMRDGLLTSVDNSRPAVLNAMGGGRIRARIRAYDDLLAGFEIERFTVRRNNIERVPSTWGEAVEARIWRQGDQFMFLYPNGSQLLPKISGAPVGSIWGQYNQLPWMR